MAKIAKKVVRIDKNKLKTTKATTLFKIEIERHFLMKTEQCGKNW